MEIEAAALEPDLDPDPDPEAVPELDGPVGDGLAMGEQAALASTRASVDATSAAMRFGERKRMTQAYRRAGDRFEGWNLLGFLSDSTTESIRCKFDALEPRRCVHRRPPERGMGDFGVGDHASAA